MPSKSNMTPRIPEDDLAILLIVATVVLVVVYAGVRLLDMWRAIP